MPNRKHSRINVRVCYLYSLQIGVKLIYISIKIHGHSWLMHTGIITTRQWVLVQIYLLLFLWIYLDLWNQWINHLLNLPSMELVNWYILFQPNAFIIYRQEPNEMIIPQIELDWRLPVYPIDASRIAQETMLIFFLLKYFRSTI